MYQALYRKYRPKTFDDVVGQDIIVKTIENSILHNRISHAYLFTGPRGCGKTTIAKILAKTVNCKNLDGYKKCESCVCCTQSDSENLDIIEIDAASNNGVDEIRDINNKVNLAPSLGKYKIYIIDEVHMLTIGAFNALLKTLEEPPSHVIFILATTDPQKVPITILSRCQRYDFKKISVEKIQQRLQYICNQEKIEIENEALQEIAYLGDGCLRDALSILDQVIAYADEKITVKDIYDVNGTLSQLEIQELIQAIQEQNLPDVLKRIDTYSNNGKSMIKITEEIILYLRNLLLLNLNSLNQDTTFYEPLKNKIKNEDILKNIDILNQTLLDMKKFSNPKMLLELAMIKLMDFKTEIDDEKMPTKEKTTVEPTPNLAIQTNIESKISVEKKKKKEEKNISREIELTENITREMNEFVRIRISNTLSQFSKKNTVSLKSELQQASEYLLDEKYGNYTSMLLDGTLKAASEEYIIFTYPTQHLSYKFNQNIKLIEELVQKILNKHYKLIATDDDNWNLIKDKFNHKTEKFIYQDETIDIDEIIKKTMKKNEDSLTNLFGDIVEYK